MDGKGQVVETEDFTPLPVLRERSQRFVFPLKVHLDPGHYKLRAHVDIGTGEIQEGSADVTVDQPAAARGPLRTGVRSEQRGSQNEDQERVRVLSFHSCA